MPPILKRTLATAVAVAGAAMLGAADANMGTDEPATVDPMVQQGRKALEAQDWKKAIELLSKATQANPGDSDAHSMLGYAYRKEGRFDASFAQYAEALRLDPRNRHAHEYAGEAYLLTNNLPKAEQHLAELQKICSPIPCEELKELKRAIDDYRKAKK